MSEDLIGDFLRLLSRFYDTIHLSGWLCAVELWDFREISTDGCSIPPFKAKRGMELNLVSNVFVGFADLLLFTCAACRLVYSSVSRVVEGERFCSESDLTIRY